MNKIIEIETIKSINLGNMSVIEQHQEIPFNIKRIYYLYGAPIGTKRGKHAHRSLKQLLWCPYGNVEVIIDNGIKRVSYQLNSPEKGLLILKGYWREIVFNKEGSVLCVAASDYYDETDYIRDYDEFLKLVKEGYWNNENKL